MSSTHTAILWLLLSLPALAGNSTDYSLEPAVLDGGGTAGSSANYALNPSTGSGAAGASAGYVVRGGFAGMLSEAASLAVTAAGAAGSLNERATLQLEARIRYDDDTLAALALPAASLTWSVAEGPLAAINSAGLATAGSVYQETPAIARATYQSLEGRLPLTVRNLTNDDFGFYAADGLPDPWQAQYFGETSLQTVAGSEADADADGLSNFQEYAFGMNPTQGFSGMLRWSGADLLERGVPTPFASGTAGSFTFRAVFGRRKDFVAAGLSYTVEFSGDLSSWKASTATPSVLADDGGIQAVSVPYPFFVNGKKATYFRVKVQPK